jgi:hypothetical protein
MNQYEMLARERKARKMAAAIRRCGGDGASARKLSDAEWETVAKLADVNKPSKETVKAVIDVLELGV